MTHQRLAAQARLGSGGFRGSIEPEAVRVRLLGGFGVSVGSRTVEGGNWRRRKAGSLVKLLALAEGHRLHRERVTAALWPDLDAKSAANNLHGTLHFARRALEPADHVGSRYLTLSGDLLELCPEGSLWVDVEAFEEAARTARRAREPAASTRWPSSSGGGCPTPRSPMHWQFPRIPSPTTWPPSSGN